MTELKQTKLNKISFKMKILIFRNENKIGFLISLMKTSNKLEQKFVIGLEQLLMNVALGRKLKLVKI